MPEGQEIVASELFGHYDIASLVVEKIEPLQSRAHFAHDYGLATVTPAFSTKRNATRHPNLNPAMFELGSPMCRDWLYLHCGVPAGYVFEGHLELLLAADGQGMESRLAPVGGREGNILSTAICFSMGENGREYVVFPRQGER